MKKAVIFLGVFLFADVSDTILKIQQIEHMKKNFLRIDYNIFSKWYKIGDVVEGFRIIKILDNSILLEKNSKIVVLKIRKSILKVSE